MTVTPSSVELLVVDGHVVFYLGTKRRDRQVYLVIVSTKGTLRIMGVGWSGTNVGYERHE